MTSSFEHMAVLTVSTLRSPLVSGGKRAAPVTHLTGVACTPLDPVDADVSLRMGLNSPRELLQTFVNNDVDIVEGDRLVYGGKEYPVYAVADWVWRDTTYRNLFLEDIK